MRIRRFEAPDSKTALAMVKAELGDEAVILANRTIPAGGGPHRKYGKTMVEVVAAMDYELYSMAGYGDNDVEQPGEAVRVSLQGKSIVARRDDFSGRIDKGAGEKLARGGVMRNFVTSGSPKEWRRLPCGSEAGPRVPEARCRWRCGLLRGQWPTLVRCADGTGQKGRQHQAASRGGSPLAGAAYRADSL